MDICCSNQQNIGRKVFSELVVRGSCVWSYAVGKAAVYGQTENRFQEKAD